jgi:uncharacterized protein (TIGR03067 family)
MQQAEEQMKQYTIMVIGFVCILSAALCQATGSVASEDEKPFMGRTLTQWIAALKDSNPQVRTQSTTALSIIGKQDPDRVVPALQAALTDKDETVRQYAAHAIGAFKAKAKGAIPVLIKLLDDPGKHVRSQAARTLGLFGAEAKAAAPRLKIALNDPGEYVPISAAVALWQIDPGQTEACVAALVKALGNKTDPFVRMEAAQGLEALGPAAKGAVPALTVALKDKSSMVRRSAASALGHVGEDARAAVPALVALLKDSDRNLRRAAATALKTIDPATATRRDQDLMQGTWKVVKLESKGKERRVLPNSKLVVEGDKATLFEGTKEPVTFTFKLDAKPEPRVIDLIAIKDGKQTDTLPGIYSLEDDELMISINFDKVRPRRFYDSDANQELLTFRRGEPGKLVWKEFAAKEGFTVLLPGEPEKKDLNALTLLGQAMGTQYKFRHETLRISFMVHALTYAPDARLPEPDKHLELERDALLKGLEGGKLTSEKKIKLRDVPGLDLVTSVVGDMGVNRTRMYLIKRRVFMISVTGVKDDVFSKDADKFLDSLQLK